MNTLYFEISLIISLEKIENKFFVKNLIHKIVNPYCLKYSKKVIDEIISKKLKNFVLNIYILMQTTYKPKRILDKGIK